MSDAPTISIIDDDEFVRDALQTLVESVGYATIGFSSAEEFINSNRICDTSCLIADVQMSGMSGFDLHDWLIKNLHNIPLILLTGLPTERFKVRATKSIAADLQSKPIGLERLMVCLERALNGSVKQAAG